MLFNIMMVSAQVPFDSAAKQALRGLLALDHTPVHGVAIRTWCDFAQLLKKLLGEDKAKRANCLPAFQNTL